MHIGIRFLSKLTVLTLFSITANAAPIWGSDASGNLMDSRTYDATAANDGLTVSTAWQNSAFSISWDITQDTTSGNWTYVYTVNSLTPGISHLLLEVTEADDFFIDTENSDSPIEDPQEFSPGGMGNSNPGLPRPLYGIKFDFGNDEGDATYTLTTDRAPVWGVFHAKGGSVNSNPGVGYAYSSALDNENYQTIDDTNPALSITDFIVRPDGITDPDVVVPLPAAFWLFGPALIGLIGIGRKRH